MRRRTGLLMAAMMVAGTGCGDVGPELPEDPAAALAAVEARLMEGPLEVAYRLRAEGAFEADLEGTLGWAEDAALALRAEGTFGGQPAVLHLAADADTLESGNGQRRQRQALPAHLREAVVVGWTRMGLLHNLARLTQAAPPDHAEGGVTEWVEARDVRPADTTRAGVGAVRGLRFDLVVAGEAAGEAILWVDPATARPVRRDQTVRFPQGAMRVVETYRYPGQDD